MAKKEKIHKDRISNSGTVFYAGKPKSDEYVIELKDTRTRVEKYDEMLRSNATVAETINLLRMPIASADWFIKKVSDSPEDVEAADFVNATLMGTWEQLIDEILDMLPFGFIPFELTWKDVEWNGKKMLAPKMSYINPKTVYQWFLDKENPYIVQRVENGFTANIPLEDLIIFTFRKRGDDYTGNSVLRAAFPHWYRVQQYYKFSSIAGERTAYGIPVGTYPKGVNEDDPAVIALIDSLKNLRTNEQSYLVKPEGYAVELLNPKAENSFNFEPYITIQNVQIARAAMVGFMQIGSTSNGSRAATYDQSTIFEKSIESIAKYISSVINTQLIPKMIAYNFPDVKEYPQLACSNIKRDDIVSFADIVQKLVSSGALAMTPNTETWLREKIQAPEREDIYDDTRKNEMVDNEKEMTAAEKKTIAVERLENESLVECVTRAIPILIKEGKSQEQAVAMAYSMCSIQKSNESKESQAEKEEEVMTGASFFRALTAAEQNIPLENLEKKIDRDEERMRKELEQLTQQQIDALMVGLLVALRSQEPLIALSQLQVDLVSEYGAKILEKTRQTFEYAKMMTADEMEALLGEGSVPVPKTTQDEINKMSFKSIETANENAQKLLSNTKTRAAEMLDTGRTPEEIVSIVKDDVTAKQDKIIDATVAASVITAINQGREFVQDINLAKIQAFQYSAILDKRTCNFCRALDGRVVAKNDPAYKKLMPPQHFACRCIWVEIVDGQEVPPITGIPEEINQDMGLSTFKNIDKKTLNDIQ